MDKSRPPALADVAVLGVNLGLAELAEVGASLGGLGAWSAEYTRDPFLALSVLMTSESTRVGTAIAQAFPRSPLVTAHAALDFDELSDGRFALGLGSQVARANLKWHGVDSSKPVARMEDYVRAVRAACEVFRGGPPEYAGEFFSFDLRGRWRTPAPLRTPPILIAAAQTRMAEAAGRVADGVVGHMLCTPDFFEARVRTPSLEAARTEGRNPEDLEFLVYRCCVVDDGSGAAVREARRQIGFYAATKTYQPALAEMGFEREAVAAQAALAGGDHDELIEAVSEDMLHAFSAVGSVADCVAALEPLAQIGDRLLLFPPYLDLSAERLVAHHQGVAEVARTFNARA